MSTIITDNATISQQIIRGLPLNATDSEVLNNLISTDIQSEKKRLMQEGEDYYIGKHDILDRKIEYYDGHQKKEDLNATNNKLAHLYHKLLVDQKTSYIVGKPVVVASDDEAQQELTNDALGIRFDDIMNDWVTGTSNKGIEWLHPYLDSNGEFRYIVIDARECIPIWETQYEDDLKAMIHYYKMISVDDNGNEETLYRAEWWDSEKVTTFDQVSNSSILGSANLTQTMQYELVPGTPDAPNPRYHMMVQTDGNLTGEGKGWGKVPFIPLYNNSKQMTDLEPVKSLIDNYDFSTSDFSNTIADIQDAIWALIGYEGQDLSEFRNNLKSYKVISLAPGEGSRAEPMTLDFPFAGRDSLLDRLDDDIFTFGMGVDAKTDKFGNAASGITLKLLYSGLNLKADLLIRKMKVALQEFMWFVTEHINRVNNTNYDYMDLTFIINKTLLIDEKEQSEKINEALALNVISMKTARENHPLVDNVTTEEERIAKQELDMPTVDLTPDEPEEVVGSE